MKLRNPILRGFNPDPSFCRVGDDYYIATSTFEWYPGVQIHHSKDLANWDLVTRPLNREIQLDMRGNPDSGGIWAPALSYSDGLFWLIYTDVKRLSGSYKDAHNYVVTAPDITGPWSDPIYMNSSGFDPSIFHDDDGRIWMLNVVWDHRGFMDHRNAPHDLFGGILLQEFDPKARKLVGPIKRVFHRSPHGMTEAPHLMKRNGWYYLITAEGGTSYEHAITYARSRTIDGPYEIHPDTHILTAKDHPESPIQKVGHGQPVEGPNGEMLHTFLCGRPLADKSCPCGRETGLTVLQWGDDDWPYHAGGPVPELEFDCPLPDSVMKPHKSEIRYDFSAPELHIDFQWLRTPFPERLFELTPKGIELIGRESIGSHYEQSLIARRQTEHRCSVETTVEFSPTGYQQMAGLAAYYNSTKFHYLCVTARSNGQRVLTIQSCPGDWPEGQLQFPINEGIEIPAGPIQLGVDITLDALQFRFNTGDGWENVGPVLDAAVLSDEGGVGAHSSFTGNFIGIAAQDLTGQKTRALFSEFVYRETRDE